MKKKINRLEDFPELCTNKQEPAENKPRIFLNKKRYRRGLSRSKLKKSDSDQEDDENEEDCISTEKDTEECFQIRLENKIKELNILKNEIHNSSMNKQLISLLSDLESLIQETDDEIDLYSV